MSSDHGSSWDPRVVGPLDRCATCWTPLNQERAYCNLCGHVSLAFRSLPVEDGRRCVAHATRKTEWTCCLCGDPICKACCASETHPMTSIGPMWHCERCVAAAKVLASSFAETVRRTGSCIKHRDVPMAFTCVTCQEPLCLSCTYFSAKGFFKKRPAGAPYCLGCFRMATLKSSREDWFSGHDVAPAFLWVRPRYLTNRCNLKRSADGGGCAAARMRLACSWTLARETDQLWVLSTLTFV
jgi:hypothetical protein